MKTSNSDGKSGDHSSQRSVKKHLTAKTGAKGRSEGRLVSLPEDMMTTEAAASTGLSSNNSVMTLTSIPKSENDNCDKLEKCRPSADLVICAKSD